MGKSSSSLKKKRSKKSSKAQKSSKSKSRKYRKKEQRKFDHDDSTSLSSSSEDSYRVRRVQTRTKRDLKGHRKRAQKRSYSSDGSNDSLHVRRKRKRSKRKNDYEVREKPYKKKRIRREASDSSMSSRSQSCSTCRRGTAGSDDSEFENHRGRSGRKEEDNRRLERGRSGGRKSSRYRGRSCSLCSQGRESSDERSEENYMLENSSRRLRSVITVTNKDEECGELCRNQYKEDIVDDHDYPCRSNDSNDEASKRDLDHGSLPALEEKVIVEHEKQGVDAGFGSARDRSYNDGSQYNGSNVYVAGTSESVEKKTIENSGGSLDGNDLEFILRQRALENLRKFRGNIQSTEKPFDQKNKTASVRLPPVSKKYEQVVANAINNNVSVGANCEKKTLVDETSRLPAQKGLNENKGKLESAKLHSTFAQEKVIDADNETSPASISYRVNNPELITSEYPCHSLKNSSSLKQKHAAGPREKLAVTESSIDKCTFDSARVVSHTSNDNVKNVSGLQSAAQKPSRPILIVRSNNMNKAQQDEVKENFQVELERTSSHGLPDSKSLVTEGEVDRNSAMSAKAKIQNVNNNSRDNNLSGENSLSKLQIEASQGSQFEQKTMTVMRGGEMVQVNYKVYIPKKAPALARRQLKR